MHIKSLLGFAGLASLGLTLAAPAAQAQHQEPLLLAQSATCGDLFFSPDEFAPADASNIAYDLECDGLSYDDGMICLNNPSENCGIEPYDVPEGHEPPMPDYDNGGAPSGFACLNNVNPVCENARHYGVLYTDYPVAQTSRTDAVFSQLGQSSSPATLPPRDAVAPAPAPIPGLW